MLQGRRYHLDLDCQFHCGSCIVAAQEADPGCHGLSNALSNLVQTDPDFHQSAVCSYFVMANMQKQLIGHKDTAV